MKQVNIKQFAKQFQSVNDKELEKIVGGKGTIYLSWVKKGKKS